MVIRFQCSACSRPIEVDDEWGGKPVACPYCAETVTAPRESTLDEGAVPIHPEIAQDEFADAPSRGNDRPETDGWVHGDNATGVAPAVTTGTHAPQTPRRNVPAIVSIIALSVTIASIFAGVLVSVSYAPELKAFEEQMGPSPDIAQSQAVMEELFARNGGAPPSWLLGLLLAWFCGVSSCFIGVIAGGLGLQVQHQRPLAVISLVLCSCILMIGCVLPVLLSLVMA